MTISMYKASVPMMIHGLQNLSGILTKAEAYAAAKKIDPSVLVNARLYPDMFPLARQVQITSDTAKNGAARLAGLPLPNFPDTETTFGELQERIKKTIDFLLSVDAGLIDASSERDIAFTIGGRDLKFKGISYLQTFVLPNFYFHITVVYSILRHNGLDVGKQDYLGKIQ